MLLTTQSPEETEAIGQKLASWCLNRPEKEKRALVLNLEGDLGGGKTTFVRGLARGLGISHPITSPTFVLSRRYPVKAGNLKNFYHLDFYRLAKEDDRFLDQINFRQIINCSENIVAIEWSERLGHIRPSGLILCFVFKSEHQREITLKGETDLLNQVKAYLYGKSA